MRYFNGSFYSRLFIAFVLTAALTGCKEGDSAFDFFEETPSTGNGTIEDVSIQSFTPITNPVRVTNSSSTTFAVSVNSGAGDSVQYKWDLNGSEKSNGTSPFYDLSGSDATAGMNVLTVTATNANNSVSKSFSVQKNQVPVVGATTPGAAGNNVNCGAGNIAFTVAATDADNDGLTFTWKLNGAVHTTYYAITPGANSSQNTFTPPCSLAGNNTVTVDITDGYDTTSYNWSVSVVNPSVAQITNHSPTGALIIIPSTGNQNFSISATGKNPLTYKWQLNGTDIPGQINSFINLAAASVAVGNHTLKAIVNDPDSSAEHDFTIKRNAPPALSNPDPTATVKKLNYQSFTTFKIDGSDGNNDTISYTWTLNDLASAKLTTSNTAGGSQAIFNPDASLVGSHTIKVVASDGTETSTHSWTVEVNYFTDACNNLTAGRICTVVGAAGMGSGINPTTNPQIAKVRPEYLANDGSDNFFISDSLMDVVWFHNRSGADITVLNTLVPAGQIKVVAGTGSEGTGTAGVTATKYRLYNPRGIAWDNVRKELFVSSYSAQRVVHIGSDGIARHTLCNGTTGNNTANNTEGAAATSHACYSPAGLALDKANNRLYVANYSARNIKYFDISDNNSANWVGYTLVGRKNGSGTYSSGSDNGDTGGGTAGSVARTNGPWALSLDDDGVLHFTEYSGCRVRAANITGINRYFFNTGRVVNHGKVTTLFGTGSCNVQTGAYTTMRVRRPRGLQVFQTGGTFHGWFVTNDDYDRVTFVNNTGSTITLGDRAVPGYQGQYVWGNGQDGYNGDAGSGKNSLINYAWGLEMNTAENLLILADRLNNRVRSMQINADNGSLATIMAGKEKMDFSGGSNTPAPSSVLNQTTQLLYDSTNNKILFSDNINGRIRALDLVTGAENTVVGQGLGNGDQDQEDPQDVYMRGPRGMAILNNSLIFADKYESNGTNRNCLVRVYNQNATTSSFFNTSVIAGKVATVAGNYALGCAGFTGAMEGGNATAASIYRPEGIATDGTNLYIAASQNHCILKVSNTGTITRYAGTCGSAGDTNASPVSSASVRLRYPGTIVMDPSHPGNMFVTDQTDRLASRVKYINNTGSAVSIAGISIAANSIGTLFNTGGYTWGVATFDNQVCYTSGHYNAGHLGSHNVVCKRRDDPLGNITLRVGPADGSADKGAIQETTGQEGGLATSATLASPYGLAFDANGNLYISERNASVIRMVKKWW